MDLEQVLRQQQLRYFFREGIYIVSAMSATSGIEMAQALLATLIDGKTALFLSGGKTPSGLYQQLADDDQFAPGAVGMIDERFGEKFHGQSNELLIQNTGLLRYLTLRGILFHPILRSEEGIIETATAYDQQVRALFSQYQRLVGILGIGADGHTAGIAPNRADFQNPLFAREKEYAYVDWFDDANGYFKQRITMTFLGLSMLDCYIILAFGEQKKKALELLFADGSEEEIPARFYRRPKNAKKTILLTDQEIGNW